MKPYYFIGVLRCRMEGGHKSLEASVVKQEAGHEAIVKGEYAD